MLSLPWIPCEMQIAFSDRLSLTKMQEKMSYYGILKGWQGRLRGESDHNENQSRSTELAADVLAPSNQENGPNSPCQEIEQETVVFQRLVNGEPIPMTLVNSGTNETVKRNIELLMDSGDVVGQQLLPFDGIEETIIWMQDDY